MTKGIRLLAKTRKSHILFAAVGNQYRTAIVYLLLNDSYTPKELSMKLGISQPLVVHHIIILEKAGWVGKLRIGKHVHYSAKKQAWTILETSSRLHHL